jgi:hypothetical protein
MWVLMIFKFFDALTLTKSVMYCKAVEWSEHAVRAHDLFIPKDIWRIFDSKGLVDFFNLQWQFYCLTGFTVKHYDE